MLRRPAAVGPYAPTNSQYTLSLAFLQPGPIVDAAGPSGTRNDTTFSAPRLVARSLAPWLLPCRRRRLMVGRSTRSSRDVRRDDGLGGLTP